MNNKQKQKPILTVPKGYTLEELFDVDDSNFNEPPLKTEEVEINFERDDDRKQSSV